MHPSNKI